MTDQLCPGSCNGAYRKAEAAYQAALAQWRKAAEQATETGDEIPDLPEDHGIQPSAAEPIWCTRCQWTIRERLLALDDLAAILQAGIDGHRGYTNGDKVTGSKTTPSPAPPVDLYDQLVGELTDWEDWLREHLNYPTRPTRTTKGGTPIRGATALTTTIAWLAMYTEQALAHPEHGKDLGDDIHNWHARLQTATKTTPDIIRKKGRCPRCHAATLMLVDADRPADRRVECQSCQRTITMDEYDQLADTEVTGGAA